MIGYKKMRSNKNDTNSQEEDKTIFRSLMRSISPPSSPRGRSNSSGSPISAKRKLSSPGLSTCIYSALKNHSLTLITSSTVSLIEEKVVKVIKRDTEELSGPPTVFLETEKGLKVQTVDEAISDVEHAKEFTGHSDIVITEAERAQVQRDETGLPINHHSTKRSDSFHKSPVLSRGASGPVTQLAQLSKMKK